jgi:hypothetical protein
MKEHNIIFQNGDSSEVMRFEPNGDIYVTKNGKGRKVECDKDLARAFQYVVIEMTGLDPKHLIKKIKEEK